MLSSLKTGLRHFRAWRTSSLVVDSTLSISLLAIALASMFALMGAAIIRDHETYRMLRQVDDLLSTVESTVQVACFTKDLTLAQDAAKGLMTNRLISGVKITAGVEVLAVAHRQDAPSFSDAHSVSHAISSPFNVNETVGEIELTTDNDYIRREAFEYSIISSIALALEVVAIVCAVALVMFKRVVRPIRTLSDRIHVIPVDSGERVQPPAGNADNEIGQLAGDFNDLIAKTTRLLTEEQKMRQEIALSENRLRTLVENSPDIIVRYDREFRLVFVNGAYERETGVAANRTLGQYLSDQSLWRPKNMTSDEYLMRLQRVMDTGTPDLIQLEWHRPDGQWVSHEMYVVAEYDVFDQVVGTLAIGRDVTERKMAERLLQHQATYDALTGLPNRRLFHDRLHEEIAKAKRGHYPVGLLFIDLDRFKEVNDTLGHTIGDALLVEAAQRIHAWVREYDIVARLAGDEFVVILPNISETCPLERIAGNIVSAMAQPFHFGEQSAFVSASIGVALFPQDADNEEGLIACADQAMYKAKQAGRDNFSFFTPDMLDHAQQRLQLINDLRGALSKNQLEVFFQPIIDTASGDIVKAEALLRWHHTSLGLISPDRFIGLAEEAGLIHDIGDWVFRETVDTVKRWIFLTGQDKHQQISVNISPRQFVKGDSVLKAIAYLRSSGLEPEHIGVEITENILLEDSPIVNDKLQYLRLSGIEISLDDFGTGYSSMAYLKKFNIDYLKIDRSFVLDLETDLSDKTIAEAIVVMAHRLGLKVIAEGVETPGQLAILTAVGCEYVQGYLYARPMPAAEFLLYVMQNQDQRMR
ncbi:MAG: EAL domain-containing protein [Methylomonas sp.]|nr:EAL domain-containing protein [Methylomonas sp.]